MKKLLLLIACFYSIIAFSQNETENKNRFSAIGLDVAYTLPIGRYGSNDVMAARGGTFYSFYSQTHIKNGHGFAIAVDLFGNGKKNSNVGYSVSGGGYGYAGLSVGYFNSTKLSDKLYFDSKLMLGYGLFLIQEEVVNVVGFNFTQESVNTGVVMFRPEFSLRALLFGGFYSKLGVGYIMHFGDVKRDLYDSSDINGMQLSLNLGLGVAF